MRKSIKSVDQKEVRRTLPEDTLRLDNDLFMVHTPVQGITARVPFSFQYPGVFCYPWVPPLSVVGLLLQYIIYLDDGIAAKRRKGKALVHRNAMQGGCGIRMPPPFASQSAHTGQQG